MHALFGIQSLTAENGLFFNPAAARPLPARSEGRMNPILAYALQLTAVYVAWAGFGFLFGWHWLVLLISISFGRKQAERCWTRQHCVALCYFLLWWVAVLATALGGGYARSGTYDACEGGEDMSRGCLFNEQSTDYVVIYVAHFIGLGWVATMWVFDGVQIPFWVWQASHGQELRLLGSADVRLAGAAYPGILSCTVLLVTLTWTAALDWSTDGGVQALALALFLEIVAAVLIAAAVVHRARWLALLRGERRAPRMGSGKGLVEPNVSA